MSVNDGSSGTMTFPSGWKHVQLGHVAKVGTGSADLQDANPDGMYPFFVRSENVVKIDHFTHDTEAVLTAGDGNVGDIFHHVKDRFAVHQRVYVIEPDRHLTGRYLYYVMGALFKESLKGNTAKSTVESLRRPMLTSFQIPLPSIADQKIITDYLDHETAEIDAFIQDQETFSALIDERQRARTFGLAAGGYSNGEIRDSYVSLWSGLPNDWSMQKLGWHFKVGNGSTPKSDNPRYWSDDGFPWVNSSVVNEDRVVTPSRYVSAEALHELHLPIVPAGSLLIGLTGQGKTRGTVTTLGIETTINQHVAYLIPRKDAVVTAEYLRLVLEASYSELRNLSDGIGGTKGALTCEVITQYRIPVPPLAEQNRLVAQHQADQTKVHSMLEDARLAIALAKERRAALISAAVTGQLDVTKKHRPVAEVLEDEVGVRV